MKRGIPTIKISCVPTKVAEQKQIDDHMFYAMSEFYQLDTSF